MEQNYWEQFKGLEDVKIADGSDKFTLQNKDEVARAYLPLVNPKTAQIALKPAFFFRYEDKVSNTFAKFLAPKDTNSQAYKKAIEMCGMPIERYVTPILVYSTNEQGRVISGDDFKLTTFILTPTRIKELQSIQQNYSLADVDLGITLLEANFQNLKIQALPSCFIKQGFAQVKTRTGEIKQIKLEYTLADITKEAMEVMENAQLAVASNWSEEQILAFFNKESDTQYQADSGEGFYDKKYPQNDLAQQSTNNEQLYDANGNELF